MVHVRCRAVHLKVETDHEFTGSLRDPVWGLRDLTVPWQKACFRCVRTWVWLHRKRKLKLFILESQDPGPLLQTQGLPELPGEFHSPAVTRHTIPQWHVCLESEGSTWYSIINRESKILYVFHTLDPNMLISFVWLRQNTWVYQDIKRKDFFGFIVSSFSPWSLIPGDLPFFVMRLHFLKIPPPPNHATSLRPKEQRRQLSG